MKKEYEVQYNEIILEYFSGDANTLEFIEKEGIENLVLNLIVDFEEKTAEWELCDIRNPGQSGNFYEFDDYNNVIEFIIDNDLIGEEL